MLEKIMDLVKGQVADKVAGEADIPEDKKSETVEATTASIVSGLRQYITPDTISSLASMLGHGNSNGSATQQQGIANGLQSGVISNLTSKVGLSAGTAQKLAAAVIPAVMALFAKKVNDNNDPDFNIGSLLGNLSGKKDGNENKGIMDMIGGFFGK